MTQLVITLKDRSYLSNIRRIVKSLQGVDRVSVSRQKKTNVASANTLAGRKRRSADFLKGLSVPDGTTSREMIDDYLAEKYGA